MDILGQELSKYQKIGRYHNATHSTPHHTVSQWRCLYSKRIRACVILGRGGQCLVNSINLLKGHSQSVAYFSNNRFTVLCTFYDEATTTRSCKTYAKLEVQYCTSDDMNTSTTSTVLIKLPYVVVS